MTSSSYITRYCLVVIAAALALILAPLPGRCGSVPVHSRESGTPDVLVLVLAGFGSADLVSVNYNSLLSESDVKRDVEAIGKECGWRIDRLRITSKATGGTGPKTTSGSFEVTSALGYATGDLPVAAFVQALKRFRVIDLNFVVPERFTFRGPGTYEDGYVKILSRRSGSAYNYRVLVKDSSFGRLVLKPPAVKTEQSRPTGLCQSPVLKLVIIVLSAICCATAVFYIGRAASGARSKSQRG